MNILKIKKDGKEKELNVDDNTLALYSVLKDLLNKMRENK